MAPFPALKAPGRPWCIRPFDLRDVKSLALHANDARVAATLTDRFPHPYGQDDAREWIAFAATQEPRVNFAIAVDGEAVGGIGLMLGQDVYARGAELGYWLGRAFWSKGISSWAVAAFADWASAAFALERLEARVYANNPASARVLEKCGFAREGTLRRAVYKGGELLDAWIYARLRHSP